MRAEVQDFKYIGEHCIIRVANDVGEFMGVWYSSDVSLIGDTVFIELDLPAFDNNQVAVVSCTSPTVSTDGKAVSFVGLCEAIDDVYVVRFASDWLTMVEIADNDNRIRVGDMIAFSVDCMQVEIYPYN